MKITLQPVGEINIELLEPLSYDSNVARLLSEKAEGGRYIVFAVKDVEKSTKELNAMLCEYMDRGYPPVISAPLTTLSISQNLFPSRACTRRTLRGPPKLTRKPDESGYVIVVVPSPFAVPPES